jgi:hypothetical protein
VNKCTRLTERGIYHFGIGSWCRAYSINLMNVDAQTLQCVLLRYTIDTARTRSGPGQSIPGTLRPSTTDKTCSLFRVSLASLSFAR